MPPSPSSFALEFSSQGAPASLLEALTGQVLRHAGCAELPAEELAAALEKALATGAFGGPARCDIQLRANGHTVDILVSANGGRIWQTRCTIP